jgi:hypothetical protein
MAAPLRPYSAEVISCLTSLPISASALAAAAL